MSTWPILLVAVQGCSRTSTESKAPLGPVAIDGSGRLSTTRILPHYEITPGKGISGCEVGDDFQEAMRMFAPPGNQIGPIATFPELGVIVASDDNRRVNSIYFQFAEPTYKAFEGRTSKRIGGASTIEDVLKEYGVPTKDEETITSETSSSPGRRERAISYRQLGIVFVFSENKLNRIAAEKPEIPKNPWFQEQLQGDVPVVVDFTAKWCHVCAPMADNLHKLQDTYGTRLKLVEVDIDQHRDLPIHFRVDAVPYLIVIQNGHVLKKAIGLQSHAELVELLTPIIGQP